jgi:hypothetical protein
MVTKTTNAMAPKEYEIPGNSLWNERTPYIVFIIGIIR